MSDQLKAEYFPWLIGRENPHAKPEYKIVARSMSLSGNSIVMLHKAGNHYVENYFIRDIINNKKIETGMDKKEFDLLKWVIHSEDSDPLMDIRMIQTAS